MLLLELNHQAHKSPISGLAATAWWRAMSILRSARKSRATILATSRSSAHFFCTPSPKSPSVTVHYSSGTPVALAKLLSLPARTRQTSHSSIPTASAHSGSLFRSTSRAFSIGGQAGVDALAVRHLEPGDRLQREVRLALLSLEYGQLHPYLEEGQRRACAA